MRGMRAAVFLVLLGAAAAHAQDLEPRLYTNLPRGLNFLVAGYGYSDGNVLFDPSVPLKDGNVRIHGPVFGYARSLDLWGMSGKFDAVLAYGCASGSAVYLGEFRERDICGAGDPKFRISANLYGAPSLTLEEFPRYRQDLIVGASLQISAPLGQYDGERLLNIGTNRWFFKPEIGIGKALGPVTLELNAAAFFYTRNSDFLGGHKKEQEPLYSFQGHIVYAFRSGIWFAVDGTYYRGGRTSVDGVKGDDLQENSRLGATLAVPLNRYHSVKLHGSSGVSARTGTDYDTIALIWQYRWGAGF